MAPFTAMQTPRQRLFTAIATYGAVSTGVVQSADIVFPTIYMPDWSLRLVIVLAVIGLMITPLLFWGLTPVAAAGTERRENIKRDEQVEDAKAGQERAPGPSPADPRSKPSRVSRVRLGGAVALSLGIMALAIFAQQRYIFHPREEIARSMIGRYDGTSRNREYLTTLPTVLNVLAIDPRTLEVNALIEWRDAVVTKGELSGLMDGEMLILGGEAGNDYGTWKVTMNCAVDPADSVLKGSYELEPRTGNPLGPQRGDMTLRMNGMNDVE